MFLIAIVYNQSLFCFTSQISKENDILNLRGGIFMQLEQFRYANEIAKCGSITKAAKNLFVSQPSLTIAIQKLETELGFALFIRSSKGIQITPKGEEALATIQQILSLTENLTNLSPESNHHPTTMTLPVFPTLYDLIDESIYEHIHTHYPQLICEIVELTANTILQEIRNASLDYAICGCPSPVYDNLTGSLRQGKNNNIETKILYEEPLLLLLPAAHPLMTATQITISDLVNETFLYFGEHLDNDKQPNILDHHSFKFNEVLPFYRRTSIMKAISMKKGVSILPESQFRNELPFIDGKVCARAIDDFDNTYVHYLIYNKRHIFTQIETDVINIIEKFYADL